MCRNIRTLHHFLPPANDEEIRAAALQYVRKVAGMSRPSQANAAVFERAVDEVAGITSRLLAALVGAGPLKDRQEEVTKARTRWADRQERLQARLREEPVPVATVRRESGKKER